MASARHGATAISDIRRGAMQITAVRRGATLVWQRTAITDLFDRGDADTLGSAWTEHNNDTYHLGVENSTARVRIPEGLIGGQFSLSTSRMRYNAAVAPGDDGYLEVVPASLGNGSTNASPSGYVTDIYHRLSNNGFSDGVGLRLKSGHFWLAYRRDSSTTSVADCGSFQPGDTLLKTALGNLHTVYRNGRRVARWTDTGYLVRTGSGYRSMGLRGDGAKDFLGPRRFSPAIDSVVMG